MATLSFSQALVQRPLLRFHLALPPSKPNSHLSIRSSSSTFNDKTSVTLNTRNNHPPLNNPLACRFHTAQYGGGPGQEGKKSYVEAYAVGRNIRLSANKARLVIDQIRGRPYEETLMILELMPFRACDAILKLVFSAAANASHNLGLNKGSLIISKAEVNEGATMKRLRPQARGRGYTIRRRTCHITIVVKGLASESEVVANPV